jgi:hypothetical protein
MLLDSLFTSPHKLETFIVIKDGAVQYKTRNAPITVDHEMSEKPLFPINKIRQK